LATRNVARDSRWASAGKRVLLAALALALALAAFPAAAGASFPGTNGRIVFQNQQEGGIYTIGIGGRARTFLANGFEPSWSPSGDFIVYTTQVEGGHFALKMMRADGTVVRTVITSSQPMWEPAFSPTGGQIVYRRGGARESENGDLYIVNTRGQYNHLLVKNGASPDWSEPTANAPNGSIAFNRSFGSCAATGLYSVDPSGANLTPLPFSCNVSFGPSWNPAATRLAFASYGASGPTNIYTGDGAGSTRSQLTNLPDYDLTPAYSPNGARVVFSQGIHGEGGLYLVTLRHPFVETAIPFTKQVRAGRPDWQPR